MKVEKFFNGCVCIAAVGILIFWIAGFRDNSVLSAIGLFGAGVVSFFGLIAKGVKKYLKNRHINY